MTDAIKPTTNAELAKLRTELSQVIQPEAMLLGLIARIDQSERVRDLLMDTVVSIANNSCCGPCQEAKMVAKAALSWLVWDKAGVK